MKFIYIVGLIVILSLTFVSAKDCGGDVACECGDNLTSSQTMWYDLDNCSDILGIKIGVDGINLDCNGHLIKGLNESVYSYGIFIYERDDIGVNNCVIEGFSEGISLNYCYDSSFNDNVLTNNYYGLASYQSRKNNLISNNISNNNESGIYFYRSRYTNLFSNEVYGNYYGMYLNDSSSNSLNENKFYNNEQYSLILRDCSNNIVWNNTFANNGSNAYEYPGFRSNLWNLTYIGNKWDDFESNEGYPDKYVVDGPEDGVDWHPYGKEEPDRDLDNDSVNNEDDKCPEIAGEIYEDGCPDITKPVVSISLSDYVLKKSDVVLINCNIDDKDPSPTYKINVTNPDGLTISIDNDELTYSDTNQVGVYSVGCSVMDKGGNIGIDVTNFEVVDGCGIIIRSPNNISYDTDRINFTIYLSDEFEYLKYTDLNEKKAKNYTLCRDCDEYGVERRKLKDFDDGSHNLIFYAVNENETCSANVSFFVDSTKPKVLKQEPKNKGYCNGIFNVKYDESFLKRVYLYYDDEIIAKDDCESGKSKECEFDIELQQYERQVIDFYFEVEDSFWKVPYSREYTCTVDTIPVNIENLEVSVNGRYAYFNITLNETARYLKYVDDNNLKKGEELLCSKCDEYGVDRIKRESFSKGQHNLTIFTLDGAGNRDSRDVSFTII